MNTPSPVSLQQNSPQTAHMSKAWGQVSCVGDAEVTWELLQGETVVGVQRTTPTGQVGPLAGIPTEVRFSLWPGAVIRASTPSPTGATAIVVPVVIETRQ